MPLLGSGASCFLTITQIFFKKRKAQLAYVVSQDSPVWWSRLLGLEVGVVGIGSSAVLLATLWTFSQVLHLSEP